MVSIKSSAIEYLGLASIICYSGEPSLRYGIAISFKLYQWMALVATYIAEVFRLCGSPNSLVVVYKM